MASSSRKWRRTRLQRGAGAAADSILTSAIRTQNAASYEANGLYPGALGPPEPSRGASPCVTGPTATAYAPLAR
jgi:hypothetical protein